MKHERTKALYQYWNGVRGTRRAPRRLEIEPGAIAPLLPNVFILERLEPASFRIRLAGTHLCGYCGQELRGRLFTSLWPDEERAAVQSLLQTVTQDAAGAVAGLAGREPQGRAASFELLLLPLATTQGLCERVIGAISSLDQPYWLGNWPIIAWNLKSTRILWPDGTPPTCEEPLPVAYPPQFRGRLKVIEGGLSEHTE